MEKKVNCIKEGGTEGETRKYVIREDGVNDTSLPFTFSAKRALRSFGEGHLAYFF